MNNIQIFNNPDFGQIRTIEKDGEPWLVGKDVATALGYSEPSKAVREKVSSEDKGMSKMDTPGGIQNMTIINESGLYSLVLASKLPTAKKFKRWVTSEVLPTIRRHGAYMTDNTLEQMISNPEFGIRLLRELDRERKARERLEAKAEQDAPKVLFAEAVETAHTSILIGELAKILKQNGKDIGQNKLFEWLRNNGYLIKRKGSDYNMPTQKSMELKLMEIKERTVSEPTGAIRITKTPKITGKGQTYFINKLLNEDE